MRTSSRPFGPAQVRDLSELWGSGRIYSTACSEMVAAYEVSYPIVPKDLSVGHGSSVHGWFYSSQGSQPWVGESYNLSRGSTPSTVMCGAGCSSAYKKATASRLNTAYSKLNCGG